MYIYVAPYMSVRVTHYTSYKPTMSIINPGKKKTISLKLSINLTG